MASPTTATFSCAIRGDFAGDSNVLVQWAINAPYALETTVECGAGFNLVSDSIITLTPFNLIILIPPTTNTDPIRLKGINGDFGFVISSNSPTILAGVTSGSFGLTCTVGGYNVIARYI
jgi:hypothetical protein